jgi:hypothetical protein
MNSTRPGISSRLPDNRRAAPASIATWVSCPHACIVPSLRELKSSPVSSCSGNASMSPRSSTVGPGTPPVSIAAMPLVVSCSSTSSGRPSIASSTISLVTGNSLPISGRSWSCRRSRTASSWRSLASSRSVSTVIGAW